MSTIVVTYFCYHMYLHESTHDDSFRFFSTFPSLVASSITETYAGAKNWVNDKKQEEVESHDGESSKLKTLEEQCMATTDEFCGL